MYCEDNNLNGHGAIYIGLHGPNLVKITILPERFRTMAHWLAIRPLTHQQNDKFRTKCDRQFKFTRCFCKLLLSLPCCCDIYCDYLLTDLQKLLQTSHFINGRTISVQRLLPKKRLPPDPLRVYVRGVNEKTTEDCLLFYLEKFSDVEVKEVVCGWDGKAMAIFASEPGNELQVLFLHFAHEWTIVYKGELTGLASCFLSSHCLLSANSSITIVQWQYFLYWKNMPFIAGIAS